eukprot:s1270_g31.t1
MSPQNPDFIGFFPSLPGGGIPAGVRAANVYNFAPMSAAEYAGHMEAGRQASDAERLLLGIAAAAPAVPAVAPAVAHVAAAAKPVASAEASAGSDLSAADDVRTLEVRYGLNGERLRSFRESVNELQEVEFSDYPLEPRTALSYAKAIASIAESATAQHHMWINSSRIPDGDRSVYEDEVLARILDTAVTYDALNVANLASMELVCSRRQLLALSALRVVSSTYSPVEPGVGTPVPMNLASLLLPDGTVAGVDLVGALHEPVKGMVLDFENAMLQDADRFLGLGREHVVLDSSPAPDFSPHIILTMPYCDNIHYIGDDAVTVDRATGCVCDGLEALGFTLHEEQSATAEMETLGGVVDGRRGQVRTTSKRIAYLSAAFDYVQTIVVSVEDIQRLLGHAMVVCVLNRSGMSIFRRLYDFVSSCSSPRRLTHLECMECKVFSGILPLLFADLRRPWSEEVHITDASPTGFGICSRSIDPQLSQDIGKWNERLRFKRLPPEQWKPRRRAAGLDPFSDIGTVLGVGDDFDELYGYCNKELFPEVPHQVLNAPDWKTVKMGRWKRRDEHITLKEDRALAFCVRRLSRASKNRNHRHLIFVDSMALAFAVTKGRAHSFGLLRVCQQLSALSLACGFSLRLRCVPSELNCADGPSMGQKHPGPFQEGTELRASNSAATSTEERRASALSNQGSEGLSEVPGSCTSGNAQEEGEAAQCDGCEPNASSSAQSSWEAPHLGREGCGETGADTAADRVGRKEHIHRSSHSVQIIPDEVREFLQGRRLAVASCRKLRRGFGRILGYHVLGQQVGERRGENGRSRGVQFPRTARSFDKKQAGFEGMEEGATSQKQTSDAGHSNGRYGHGYVGKRKASLCFENGGGFRYLPSSWRVRRLERKRCGYTSA